MAKLRIESSYQELQGLPSRRKYVERGLRSPESSLDPKRPTKKPKLDLGDENSESDRTSTISVEVAGNTIEKGVFRINDEYARRFEHNKKREELHRREYDNLLHTGIILC